MNKPPGVPVVSAPLTPRVGVPKHRQCPACYGGRGGVGKRKWQTKINSVLARICYACNICGFQWSVKTKTVRTPIELEWDEVEVEYLPGPELEER